MGQLSAMVRISGGGRVNSPPSRCLTKRQRGFSLIEVLVSVAMLLGSIVVLSQLTAVGRRHLDAASEKAIALRLCQNEMARLLGGVNPIEPRDEMPLADDPNWESRVDIVPLEMGDLFNLRVSVRRAPLPTRVERESGSWFTLVRWVPAHLVESRAGSRELAQNQDGSGSAPEVSQ
jgi:prepilin-type N-terminal cleavage/methylation domain-containing protein